MLKTNLIKAVGIKCYKNCFYMQLKESLACNRSVMVGVIGLACWTLTYPKTSFYEAKMQFS